MTIPQLSFSLIIPCYNEAASLPALIDRCGAIFSRDDVEVILVDNGSTDDSPTILANLLAGHPVLRTVRVERNQGYGHGILTGLRAARGRVLGWTHADLQTDPADVLRGLALFETAPDRDRLFVKGRRSGRPFSDIVFTVGMSCFETLLLRRPLWDINAQPTIFSRGLFESWDHPPQDFSLDLYAYYRARCLGFAIARFPVHFGKRIHGVSHWNINWRAKVKFIRRTVDFSLRLRRSLKDSRT
ncbi:Glycosyltransferase involved in cell wall biosynthesis [Azospirillaceae bacterium]